VTQSTLAQQHAQDAELPEPPFAVAHVTEMMTHLTRAMRAHQLYMHNNPTYLKSLENLRAAVRTIWQFTGDIILEVTETQLKWEGRVVMHEPDKASDNMPWLLYKDGVRELRLMRDVEQQELIDLLDLLCRVRRSPNDEEDLLTLLWEREFNFITYRYIDLALEAEPIERLDEESRERLRDSRQQAPELQEQILPPGVVNLDAFDATLYFLEESEIEYLRGEIRNEYQSDLRRNVLGVLLDIYESQADPRTRAEVLAYVNSLMVTLLVAGHYSGIAYLLRELRVCAERAPGLTDADKEALHSVSGKLSEPESLAQLLTALDERADLPPEEDIEALFEQLRPTVLGAVLGWLGRLQSVRVRALLEKAADRLAAANTSELIRLINSPETDVALEAVKRAGAMRASAAVTALGRVLGQGAPALRLAAVAALGEIASPGALQQLEATIDDEDRDIRVAGAKVFTARTHRAALPRHQESPARRRRPDRTHGVLRGLRRAVRRRGCRAARRPAERPLAFRQEIRLRAARLCRAGAESHQHRRRIQGAAQGGGRQGPARANDCEQSHSRR
jgi:hypothetical protein